MKEELIQKICEADDLHTLKTLQKALEHHRLDLASPDAIRTFLVEHPDFQLPDLYVEFGGSNEILISHHSVLYNGVRHRHNFFEMVYVERGSVIDSIDGRDILLRKNEICIHNPNALHKIETCGSGDLLINILISKETFQSFIYDHVIQDKGLEGFFEQYMQSDYTRPNYLEFHNVSDTVITLMELLLSEYFSEQKSEVLLNSTLLLLFGNLIREFAGGKQDKILDYINEHLATATLENTAAYFQYHPKYFSALVKKRTRKNFKELLIELRMKKAANYLKYTDLSVEQIALEVGYNNASSFYAKFERQYGQTPREYRRAQVGEQGGNREENLIF